MQTRALTSSLADASTEPRLDDFDLAAFGMCELVTGGRRVIEAYALDRGGVRHRLALQKVVRDAAATRTALFATLLMRGLHASAPILVDADDSAALRQRIVAAWGTYAVVVG